MIIADAAETITTTAAAAPSLIGTIATRILRPDGTVALGGDRSTEGIAELLDGDPPAPTGLYVLERSAPTLQGRYSLVWDLGSLSAQTVATEEIIVALHGEVTVGAAEYAPTVSEVAAYIRARTRDANGDELGTFTTATRPTDAEVQTVIGNAAGKLAARVGDTVPAALAFAAREVVALRAALLVELTFFGDQIQAGRSPYNELKQLYDQSYTELLDARKDLGADLAAGTDDDLSPAGLPAFAFSSGDPCHVAGTELPWPAAPCPWGVW